MARQVDIWWTDGGRLKASMRWSNKRGRISFFLIPAGRALCDKCPFMNCPVCSKWRAKTHTDEIATIHLCSALWEMEGDNKFENRDKIKGWQPIGPLGNEKKKE